MKYSRSPGFILVALALLAGCASQPINHYSLLPSASKSDVVAATGGVSAEAAVFLLDIQPVGLPALSDRQEFVVRQGDRFVILENQRWASVLSDEFRSALGLLMQRRLGVREVTGLIPPAGATVLKVKVMVRQFEVLPGQYAVVDADWSLSRNDQAETVRLLCHTRKSIDWPASGGNGADALSQAYQQAFDALGGEIAGTANHWIRRGGNACVVSAR